MTWTKNGRIYRAGPGLFMKKFPMVRASASRCWLSWAQASYHRGAQTVHQTEPPPPQATSEHTIKVDPLDAELVPVVVVRARLVVDHDESDAHTPTRSHPLPCPSRRMSGRSAWGAAPGREASARTCGRRAGGATRAAGQEGECGFPQTFRAWRLDLV